MRSVDRAECRWAVENDSATTHVMPHGLYDLLSHHQRHANHQGGRNAAVAILNRVAEARLDRQYSSVEANPEHATGIVVARRVRLGKVQRHDRRLAATSRKLESEARGRHERSRLRGMGSACLRE